MAGMYFYPAKPKPNTGVFLSDVSQTIVPGSPLIMASGYLQVAASGQASLFGFAASYATSGGSEHLPVVVWLADDYNTFYGNSKAVNIAATVVGTSVDIDLTTTVWSIDTEASTDDLFVVLGKHPRDSWAKAAATTVLEVKVRCSQLMQRTAG